MLPPPTTAAEQTDAAAANLVAADGSMTELVSQAAALEQAGDDAGAVSLYREAHRLAPREQQVGVRLAFLLLKTGHAEEAVVLAGQLTAENASPDALLMLGLSQRALHDPESDVTLRRFLQQAPTHPAVAQVRALLADGKPRSRRASRSQRLPLCSRDGRQRPVRRCHLARNAG